MPKRDDTPHQQPSTDPGAAGSARRDDGIRRIEAPRLVPAQDESQPLTGDIVTVSFEDAAREAGHGTTRDDAPATAAYERTRRFIPLAAAVAIAAAVGALTGALTTAGLSHFSDQTSVSAAMREDAHRLEGAMTKISRDLAALKTNVDASAKSASTQMARLGERLEKTDKAQNEATAKVAKLADAIESKAAADPVVTGSVATAVPAVPPLPAPAPPQIVDGWVLRSVANGAALIHGRRLGLVEVEPGDSLPGLGRIETIRRQDGRWVVVTSRGLIVPR